ncbi:hypothetical protein FACS189450_08960 [Spirochaetia bacterium]|nr:hypothetical protein FACS189450_08960 [Spirochaetia bacterium]
MYEQLKDKAETVDFSGLDNDSKNFHFDDNIFETYDKFDNFGKT